MKFEEMTVHEPQEVDRVPARPRAGAAHEPRGHGLRWLVWLIILCVVGGAAYVLYYRIHEAQAAQSGRTGPRTVPVVAALARRGDMPVYLNGMGSVTAFETVTVHSRVDGELMRVFFTEGQLVHKDDVLAQIDPRPFEVQPRTGPGSAWPRTNASTEEGPTQIFNGYVSIKDSDYTAADRPAERCD